MDFKDSLLMPKTDFPMRGNLPVREVDIQTYWEDTAIYHKMLEQRKEATPYILHDGPPYANGNIHIGHAFNKILKDVINRFYLLQGRYVQFITGWDTHGLPIEQAVTNSGIKRKEKSVAEFRTICKEYALKQVDIQMKQFDRLGIFTDWKEHYLTLLPEFEAEQVRIFGMMLQKGLIYKGYRTVYWSPSSESALAEAEVEYHDVESTALFVKFQVQDGKQILDTDTSIVIWTTTPWTLPANAAIALNADVEYALVAVNDHKYLVAKDLVTALMEQFEWEDAKVIATHKGSDLQGITTKHPLLDRSSVVVLGDHVTTEAGTGAVHTAPGYGEDDFEMGKKYELTLHMITDEKGYLTEEAQQYKGLFYTVANKQIVEDLEQLGALVKKETILHSYPHDWRTKKPIIYWVTNQWFASIDKIRETLLTEIDDHVKWYISWAATRLGNMMKSRNDWCISRQRVWGVPIPIFYTEEGNPIMDQALVEHVATLFEAHGSNIWFEKEAHELLPEGYTHVESPNNLFTKEEDIMDVWFDSGTSYAYVSKKYNLGYPMDLYFEGSDQYRGWFNSSLITGVATKGSAPYKAVASAGFVLDGKGHKMSKSLGNTIDPLKLTKQYGADIIRLWVASVDYTADVRISDDIMKQISEGYRKIRNNFRFMLGNLHEFTSDDLLPIDQLEEVDQYVLAAYQQYMKTTLAAYYKFDFVVVYKETLQFVTNTLSSFYLDYAKDILYCDAKTSVRRLQVQSVIYQVLSGMIKVLAPILSHTAEEAWQEFKHKDLTNSCDSVFESVLETAYEVVPSQQELLEKWAVFLQVRDDVLASLEEARNAGTIGKSLDAQIFLELTDEKTDFIASFADTLHALFIVSKVTIGSHDAAKNYSVAKVHAMPYDEPTCPRCWNRFEHSILDEQGLCPRCAAIVKA